MAKVTGDIEVKGRMKFKHNIVKCHVRLCKTADKSLECAMKKREVKNFRDAANSPPLRA